MAGSAANISIGMDSDLKAQADRLFGELGMNLTTAFHIFVRQSLREGRIPFDISLSQPNRETAAARGFSPNHSKDSGAVFAWLVKRLGREKGAGIGGGVRCCFIFLIRRRNGENLAVLILSKCSTSDAGRVPGLKKFFPLIQLNIGKRILYIFMGMTAGRFFIITAEFLPAGFIRTEKAVP